MAPCIVIRPFRDIDTTSCIPPRALQLSQVHQVTARLSGVLALLVLLGDLLDLQVCERVQCQYS
jgi:hypothetical protein